MFLRQIDQPTKETLMSERSYGAWAGIAVRRAPVRIAAAVLAAPTLLAACGDEPPEPEGEPLAAEDRAALGSRITAAMEDARSSRMELDVDMTVEAEGQTMELSLTGDGITETTDAPAMQFDLSMDVSGAATESIGPVGFRSDGERFLVRGEPTDIAALTGGSAYGMPGEWVEVDATQADALASSTTTYSEYAELIDTVDTADGGEDETGHRYNFVFTMEDATDAGIEMNTIGQQSLDTLSEGDREELLDTPVLVSVWLDAEDRIVRETVEMDADVSGVTVDLAATVDFTDFGTPVPTA
jgi:hypothetical protein